MRMERRKKAIDKLYKRRDRIDMPDYQREEVWSDLKKKTLIDTILRGWHIPKFYFRRLDDGSFECIDGQQRLSAIIEFFDDNLTLSPDTARRYDGAEKYSQLPDNVSDNFDDYEVDIEEIEDASDRDLEELFQRLQLGTPLNTAEKLNAILGDLRDFCHEATEKPFYTNKVVMRNTRYAHFESVVRWIYIEARGIQPQMRYSQFEGFLKENRSFSVQSEISQKIVKSLRYLEEAFPNKNRYLRNRANVLSICMLASRIIASNLDKIDPQIFGAFVEAFFKSLTIEIEKGNKSRDKELLRYQQAITSDSMGGNSIKTRINILTKRVATFSPYFAPLLGAYRDSENEAIRNVTDLANSTRELIHKANEIYSSKSGEDLFKLTNKASMSLSKIEIPCRDLNQYGDFIDALYFLIYEGSGDCKRLTSPPPEIVMDIKHLRTAIRHDINHGKRKEIIKKNLKISEIFEKYSGKRTPGMCSPEDFLSIQVRILNKLIIFIESLII